MKILVTTDIFGKNARYLLEEHEVSYNNFGRKMTVDELKSELRVFNPEIIIAGTEKYDSDILDLCPNLRVISRVGIGLDAIDLKECENRGIIVHNTPDAPSNAVVELTVAQIINCLRKIPLADKKIKGSEWVRFIGREISECEIGIVGYGRIGSKVHRVISSMNPKKIRINDIDPKKLVGLDPGLVSGKDELLRCSDVLLIHIPFNEENKNFISQKDFISMKKDLVLINPSRGGLIDEEALYSWLKENNGAMASLDVFEKEPYSGKLIELENIYLTPHLGSCSKRSREEMEVGSVKNLQNDIN